MTSFNNLKYDWRAYRAPFLSGMLVLVLELACIRWFAAYVVFLQFFSNVVLVASFLGISLGCLALNHRTIVARWFPRLLFWSICISLLLFFAYQQWALFSIEVDNYKKSAVVFYGTSVSHDLAHFLVPIEVIIGVVFVFVALLFVGPGQIMGVALDRAPERVKGYAFNVLGSLCGIGVFSLYAWAALPPVIWFGTAVLLYLLLINYKELRNVDRAYLFGTVFVVLFWGISWSSETLMRWSPYYLVKYLPDKKALNVNTMVHQGFSSWDDPQPPYSLVYSMLEDLGQEKPKEVLIIGAGSGNDVTHALQHGVARVDAVEIDPVIHSFAAKYHPDKPYSDPRVHTIIDDGRNFLKASPHTYDMIVYALVDSLVLQSSFSGVRLESFLFTVEAFSSINKLLKPGGVFVLYSHYEQGWVTGRVIKMLEATFKKKPLLISLPYKRELDIGARGAELSVIVVGETGPIQSALDQGEYWYNPKLALARKINGFKKETFEQSDPHLLKVATTKYPDEFNPKLASDDWPFLYLKSSAIPVRPYISTLLVLSAISFLLVILFNRGIGIVFNGPMFFLGAAFMLVESRAVVQLGALFGGTWLVNSVVFGAILLLVFVGNWVVARTGEKYSLRSAYCLLFAAVIVSFLLPPSVVNDFFGSWGRTAAPFSSLLPVPIASYIFARLYAKSRDIGMALSCNILGTIVGAWSEYLSMIVGFQYLLIVAGLFYLLSSLNFSRK